MLVDSCLIEVLLNDKKNPVNHEKSNGRVAAKMRSKAFQNEFCIGIIDEDRKQLDYLREFVAPKIETEFLKLWKYPDKHHYLIQIRPVIEDWILKACEAGGVNLTELQLPNTLNGLKRITKSVAARRDTKLIGLFSQMVKQQCKPALQLRSWISYLKDKNFSADLDELKNL